MADPECVDELQDAPEKITDERHHWKGVQHSLESAIQKAKLPMYDSSYARTFTHPKEQLPYDYHYKGAHARLGLAPESLYPRCDWCGQRGRLMVTGRWVFHRACADKAKTEAPATTALKSFTAYYPRYQQRRKRA